MAPKPSHPAPIGWHTVVETLTRPYPVTLPMVLLVLLVPVYLFLPDLTPVRTFSRPELALDRAIPVQPPWALVYGALYQFLILLPVFAIRERDHIRRSVYAYLFVWLSAYVCFLAYPTVAPRPAEVLGDGFAAQGLRFLYDADPPYNCFPSLHVAHSFVSALTCFRLHKRTGILAIVCAVLVGISTLYTKQHYVLDVVAGILLACAAYALFLRRYPREDIPQHDQRLAPVVAAGLLGIIGLGVAALWAITAASR